MQLERQEIVSHKSSPQTKLCHAFFLGGHTSLLFHAKTVLQHGVHTGKTALETLAYLTLLDQFRVVSSVFRERRAGRVTQSAQAEGGRTNDPEVAMDQYLLIPFLGE